MGRDLPGPYGVEDVLFGKLNWRQWFDGPTGWYRWPCVAVSPYSMRPTGFE